jgi:hypothetical protein
MTNKRDVRFDRRTASWCRPRTEAGERAFKFADHWRREDRTERGLATFFNAWARNGVKSINASW